MASDKFKYNNRKNMQYLHNCKNIAPTIIFKCTNKNIFLLNNKYNFQAIAHRQCY